MVTSRDTWYLKRAQGRSLCRLSSSCSTSEEKTSHVAPFVVYRRAAPYIAFQDLVYEAVEGGCYRLDPLQLYSLSWLSMIAARSIL